MEARELVEQHNHKYWHCNCDLLTLKLMTEAAAMTIFGFLRLFVLVWGRNVTEIRCNLLQKDGRDNARHIYGTLLV